MCFNNALPSILVWLKRPIAFFRGASQGNPITTWLHVDEPTSPLKATERRIVHLGLGYQKR
jgi:hypothetical protein